MANLIPTLLLLSLLVSLSNTVDSIPATEHKKVIEANHFYSDT